LRAPDLPKSPSREGTLLKRQGAIRGLVIVCVTLAALGILAPGKAPALNPMQGSLVTEFTTSSIWPFGPWTFTFTFTFYNMTTSMTSTTTTTSGTSWRSSITFYTTTVVSPTTTSTTITTYSHTLTSGTTFVPSTSTTWTNVAATTTNRTITTTTSETVTSTSYTTISVTSTSIYSATVTAPTTPPIPGFPLESILAGLALGLLGVHLIYRSRRANRKHPS
jgi:hypothetical protein